MIIFNTIKQAEHYVKWCQKSQDFNTGHYEWSSMTTYIEDNLVLQVHSGDTCGCGCDTYRYNNVYVIGRIKAYNTKTIRDRKMIQILDK